MDNCKFLAINTAVAVEVALGNGAFFRNKDAKCASAELMPQVDLLLCKSGLKLSDLDFIACVNGPGSFTGIRIGVSAVRSMCYALGLPALPIHYMQMLAYNENADGKNVLTVSDGSNGTAYVCEFDADRHFVTQCVCMPCADAVSLAKNYKGAVCCDDKTYALLPDAIPPFDDCRTLIRAATELRHATVPFGELIPEYIRESQAEMTLRAKERNG